MSAYVRKGLTRIYRLHGSASFLHSGELLLSLMPRSQCWCVDGASRFAMRIQQYIYRIELPCESTEDKIRIEELKIVLDKILMYEKTPCPFTRSFTVDLPENLPSPVTRKFSGAQGRARRWEFDKRWKPEGWESESDERRDAEDAGGNSQGTEDEEAVSSSRTPRTQKMRHMSVINDNDRRPSVSMRAKRFEPARSVTAPLPHPATPTPPSPLVKADTLHEEQNSSQDQQDGRPAEPEKSHPSKDDQSFSVSSSLESFRTAPTDPKTSPSSSPPTTPLSIEPESPQTPQHPTQYPNADPHAATKPKEPHVSDVSSTEDMPSKWTPIDPPTTPRRPASPAFTSPSTSPTTTPPGKQPSSIPRPSTPHSPPNPTLSRDRSLYYHSPTSQSPTFQHASLQRPPPARSPLPNPYDDEVIPTAILSKTCALLLGPPSGLVAVMMQIAARIARSARDIGEWGARAYWFRPRRRRRTKKAGDGEVGVPGEAEKLGVPGSWEDSDVEWVEEDEWSESEDDEEEGFEDAVMLTEEEQGTGRDGDGSEVKLWSGTPVRARKKRPGGDEAGTEETEVD